MGKLRILKSLVENSVAFAQSHHAPSLIGHSHIVLDTDCPVPNTRSLVATLYFSRTNEREKVCR